jgi:hypothetical protein
MCALAIWPGAAFGGLAAASPPSRLERVYATATRSLDQPGRVYHSTATVTGLGPFTGAHIVRELWVDVHRDVVREQLRTVPAASAQGSNAPTRSLIAGGQHYSTVRMSDPPVPAPSCHGASASVTAVFADLSVDAVVDCRKTSVIDARYSGRAVPALVSTGISHGEDETVTYVARMYLDPTSMLPIGGEYRSTSDNGTSTQRIHSHMTIRAEFVDASTLPSDFFTPDGLTRDPIPAAVPPVNGKRRYWLGQTLARGGGLPQLILQATNTNMRRPFLANLGYSTTQGASPVIWVQTKTAGSHPPFHQGKFEPCPGLDQQPLTGGGSLTVFCATANPGIPATGVTPIAVATFNDAVVVIETSPAIGPNGITIPNPFADPTALASLAQNLRPL